MGIFSLISGISGYENRSETVISSFGLDCLRKYERILPNDEQKVNAYEREIAGNLHFYCIKRGGTP